MRRPFRATDDGRCCEGSNRFTAVENTAASTDLPRTVVQQLLGDAGQPHARIHSGRWRLTC